MQTAHSKRVDAGRLRILVPLRDACHGSFDREFFAFRLPSLSWLAILFAGIVGLNGCGAATEETASNPPARSKSATATDNANAAQETSSPDTTPDTTPDTAGSTPDTGGSTPAPSGAADSDSEAAPFSDSPTGSAADAWRHFRGTAAATGYTPVPFPASLELAWEQRLDDTSFIGAPLIANERVYVVDADGKAFSLSLSDGQVEWEIDLDGFVDASPFLLDNYLVVGDLDGFLHCIDVTQGEVLWKQDLETSFITSVNEYQGDLIAIGETGDLFRLQAETGETIWKFPTEDRILSAPTIAEGRCLLTGCNSKLYVIPLDLPRIERAIDLLSPTGVTAAIDGDLAHFAISGGTLLCFNWKTGEKVWEYVDPMGDQEVSSSPALTDETLVIGGGSNRKVLAVARQEGAKQWEFTSRRMMNGAPIIVGDTVVIGGHDGRVYALDVASGEKRFEFECGGVLSKAPAFAAGHVVVTTNQGVVYGFAASR